MRLKKEKIVIPFLSTDYSNFDSKSISTNWKCKVIHVLKQPKNLFVAFVDKTESSKSDFWKTWFALLWMWGYNSNHITLCHYKKSADKFNNHCFKCSHKNEHVTKKPYFKVYAFMTVNPIWPGLLSSNKPQPLGARRRGGGGGGQIISLL